MKSTISEDENHLECAACGAQLSTENIVPEEETPTPSPSRTYGATIASQAYQGTPASCNKAAPKVFESWFWGPGNGILMGAGSCLLGGVVVVYALLMEGDLTFPVAILAMGIIVLIRGILITQRRAQAGESLGSQLLFDLKVWSVQLFFAGVGLIIGLGLAAYAIYSMWKVGNL